MRSFLAIPLDEATKAAIEQKQRTLRSGRPVPYENLHMTLLFLDERSEQTLEDLHRELLDVSASKFHLRFTTTESFGQVLAINVAATKPLVNLQSKLRSAAWRAGIALPRRRFRPHVTIARTSKKHPLAVAPVETPDTLNELPEMPVTGFALFRSTLRPDGARHEKLAQYQLTGVATGGRV